MTLLLAVSGISEAMIRLTHVPARRSAGAGRRVGQSAAASLALASAATEKRLVVVILRGALDGLAAVVPYGDPALTGLRGEIVPPGPGQPDGMLDLGGFYGLHPVAGWRCTRCTRRTRRCRCMRSRARYRVRSHFEAQDYLECGADHRMTSGWLNRVVARCLRRGPAAGR